MKKLLIRPRPQPTAQNWFSILWNLGTRHLFSYLWLERCTDKKVENCWTHTPNKTLKKFCSHHQDQTLAEASKTVKCKSNCDCNGQAHKTNNKSGRPLQTRKRKQVAEKENIDSETLAKYKTLEWEERTGYWCQKCSIKFPSSELLIEHMSKKDVHTKW